jgi:hypothetical protein
MESPATSHDQDHPSPPARPMSADEVLQVMIDVWRQREGIDPNVQYVVPITRRVNVERAANLMGLPRLADDWIDIATMLRDLFRVEIDKERWRAAIEPKKHKLLGPVCDLIAEHARAPLIERRFESVALNWQAAAFRSILLILSDAGVDVHGLTPRSKLAKLLPSYSGVFTHVVSRLAPGRMPALRVINHSFRASIAVLAAGAVAHIAGHVLPLTFLPALGSVLLLAGAAGVPLSSTLPAKRYRLGDLTTLADLAYALTSPPPESPEPLPPAADGVICWDAACHPLYVGLR